LATTAASSRLGVHLFGQPRFTLGGEPYAFNGRPKTVPLLAYLLLHRAGPVRRDSLAFTLWEDDEEEKARTNLRRHLHELGRLLPAAPVPWIVTEADTVLWNPAAALWFDVAEFERLIAGGDRAAAVDLYAGGLLENLYDEWLFGPRDRLHNAYLAALTELIVECRSARDFTGAKNYARRLLLADPWREDIVRQLMAVRYESGDRAGALQTFETFARSLRAEMDVDPMPETVALRDAVVRNAPAGPAHEAASEQRPAQPPAPKSVALPFVGRRNELEQLGAAWSRAARGRGSALLVSGEAGIGKTRLVGQLALQAEAEGGRVLWGATSSPESVAYQPVVDALRNALPMIATAALRPLVLASLAQISPNLRSRFPDLPVLPAIERERERTRLFDAIATAFEALAAPRPLVVVLEDLHWAEPATIAAFEFLVPRVSRRSILLIGTYRDEEVARLHPLRGLRRRLQPERLLAHLAVPPLAHEEVNELVAAPTRAAGLPLETGNDSVYAISEGNPLFVGEVIRNLVEGRTFDATLSTVHDLIGARFERLSPEARELAGIAATIGEAFDVDVLRETSGWSEPAMLAALDELQDRAIVREPVGRHRFDYAFTHNLVQRTIYASSPLPLQKRRHRRIARIMEDLFSSRLDSVAAEIARHYERGGDSARAAECYVRAARGATAVFANEEALAHARSAARLCGDDAALLFEALSIAEATNDRLGDRKAQRADLTALDKLARASDDRRQVCAILSRTVRYYRACGDREGERLTVDALKAEAQSAGDARWLGEAYEAEATYFEVIGKPAAALPVARHAVDEFDAAGDPRGLVSALTLRAAVAAHTGETAEADECINRAREVARVSQDAELAVRVLRCESNVCHWLERWQRHDEVAREALSLARSVGDRETEAT
jgi:DNA-binding SARP family transcriptional activator